MYSLNILILTSYIAFSIFLVQVFNERNKWIAILISSIIFYFYYVDIKIVVLLTIWLLIYGLGYIIKNQKLKIYFVIPILISPLIISKITSDITHYETFVIRDIDLSGGFYWGDIFEVLGLSYFTFLAVSYLVDVKRGYIRPEKNPFRLLLYLIYFPSIFSGPLHRFKYLTSQFENIHITNKSITNGARLLLWGTFKSLVVAPRIFTILQVLEANGISGYYYLLIGLLFFLYLYISFSSFIDIFQGVSEIFSIRLRDNFRGRIYLSHSRQHFWSGWHITLNEWFRDYFFFLLAKRSKSRAYINWALLLTFFLIAMWHEVSYTMAIWGVLNGLWIIIEKKVPFHSWPFGKWRNVFGVFYHLFISSILALVFITPKLGTLAQKLAQKAYIPLSEVWSFNLLITITCFIFMDWIFMKSKNKRIDDILEKKDMGFRWITYAFTILSILIFGATNQIDNYYIQF